MTPFSLRIFVADGDPDGLRIVEKSNWIGKALVFPRALLPQVKARAELAQTGVYLLLGPRPDGEGEMLYVGEGDPIRPRLESHYAQKDFWTRAIGFTTATAGQLNKAHVQFLEARLIAPLDNANQPTEPSLSEADRADMEVFLGHMLGMLPVLGVQAFEQARGGQSPSLQVPGGVVDATPVTRPVVVDTGPILRCEAGGILATGIDSAQGFVVHAGSSAAKKAWPSLPQALKQLREGLLANGVWQELPDVFRFTQDYVFSSPSNAAAVVLGRSANGRIEWKDAQGRTLKALQEAALG
jgi:hypothetical protein